NQEEIHELTKKIKELEKLNDELKSSNEKSELQIKVNSDIASSIKTFKKSLFDMCKTTILYHESYSDTIVLTPGNKKALAELKAEIIEKLEDIEKIIK